ncbi:MAG: pyridoxamine 5'-phosphate oxidase family protein [Ferruginibacter sp.]|nr:pyridoxamine 5'-phosphate oxidase family protein [Ferruginibacter sp.]
MTGELTKQEIDNVLMSQSLCRIACSDDKKPYLVPVTFAYNGTYLYGQSMNGTKLNILRKNPNVCVQVDIINSMTNWKSVIVTGQFEELKDKEAETAREHLYSKIFSLMTGSSVHSFGHELESAIDENNRIKSVMYRIKIEKITGRYQK